MIPRDHFVADNLPPRALWPTLDYSTLPELDAYPARLNCAAELLDARADSNDGERPAFHFEGFTWSYMDLRENVDRIAHALVHDLGLVPGERVLLRAPNNPMAVACWLATVKAGGVMVATMPLLRSKELRYIVDKAKVRFALCDRQLAEDWSPIAGESGHRLERTLYFSRDGRGGDELEALMDNHSARFNAVDTHGEDPVLIAFTSGTTGQPKGTVHFHRDVLAICDTFGRYVYRVQNDDVFLGSPPLAFTFGLGALVTFPMRFGASTVLVERFGPTTMLETVERYGVTGLYTSPTGYRAMAAQIDNGNYDLSSLRAAVSAGEHLPEPTWHAWKERTGIPIIDGIGATEMLHIFISASGEEIRPGSTGRAVPGFRARIVDREMADVPVGSDGFLAVQGPTGCRYLDDVDRQRAYVRDGWNLTGDVYRMDEDGYFYYVARADDMIVSAGYNISGPEVESCLLSHPDVAECAVIGCPDPERGQIAKAVIVPRPGAPRDTAQVKLLQDFVKATIAPYKYPRAIEFIDALPRTQTGKLQRFKLRAPL